MPFSQFSEEDFSKFSKIFSKFPINCLFCPNAQKINAWFVKFIEKYAKDNAFFAIFLRNLFKIFENFLKISQEFVFFV